jgi:hypothetical protein
MGLDESLERLDELLPTREPELWASLNPPVAESELDGLRRALEPYELHDELVAFLRWHDGQNDPRYNEGAWPLIECGPLLGALGACSFLQFDFLAESIEIGTWSASWVPLTAVRHSVAAVEMAKPLDGLVVDASFGEPKPRPVAQSLAALMHAICVLVEEGFPLREAPGESLSARRWVEREDLVRPFSTVYGQGLMRTAPALADAGLPWSPQ